MAEKTRSPSPAPPARRRLRGFARAVVGLALAAGLAVQACTQRDIVGVVISSVTVQPSTTNLIEGDTFAFSATVLDDFGTAITSAVVEWEVEQPSLATVDGTGLVQAIGQGDVTVRASFRGVSGTATVTVLAAPDIELTPDTVSFSAGVGDASPTPQDVAVTNAGGARLRGLTAAVQYAPGDTVDWLTAALADTVDPTTLTLSAATPGLDAGDYTASVEVDSPDDRNGPFILPVFLAVRGIDVVESGGDTQVDEDGATDDFTVVLDSQPASDVVITVTSADEGEVTVDVASLTFTSGNWDTPQTVTVTGEDESTVDGTRSTAVTLSVDDASSDDAYDALADRIVQVSVVDNDMGGFELGDTASLQVGEAGSTDEFTVVLTSQPLDSVVFDVSSADTGEATVSPARLVFRNSDWDVAQSVTITGQNDGSLIDGDQTTTITVAVDTLGTDAAFDGLAAQTAQVVTLDNDDAGFELADTAALSVTELATTDSFTVVLTAQPADSVVLLVSSGDTAEATVSPSRLSFDGLNWSVAQTVTITGVNDDLIDGSQQTLITVSVDDAGSHDNFDPLPDQTVTVTTIDDDQPGFTILESGPGTTVTEAGGSDDFEIRLNTEPQPGTVVVLQLSSTDTLETTVSPNALTFTPGDWDQTQTVTVTGVDDFVDDGDIATPLTVSVDAAQSDDDFDGVAPDTVVVTTTDDDTAGFTFVQTNGQTLVSEDTLDVPVDSFTVVLDAQPLLDVVLTLFASDTTEATVEPESFTFTTNDWDQPQTAIVTGVNDQDNDDNQASVINLAIVPALSDDAFDAVPDQTVPVTTVDDDDTAGLRVNQSGSGTLVVEGGSPDNFTVQLSTEPASDVVVTVTSSDPAEVAVDSTSLTFTNTSWNIPRSVLVSAVDESVIDGTQMETITVAVDTGASDPAFSGVPPAVLNVTSIDNDGAGLALSDTASTTVTEAGSTNTFSVALLAQPTSDVVVDVITGDSTEVVTDSTRVTFTSANWDTPKVIPVRGVNDFLLDDDQQTTVALVVDDAASDDDFDGQAAAVTVTTTDDDSAGLLLTDTTSLSVTEAGSTDAITVRLQAEPASIVIVTITSNDSTEVTPDSTALSFNSVTWDQPRTVPLRGVNDFLIDGAVVSTVDIAVDGMNSDPAFAGLSSTVSVTTQDDDSASLIVADTAATVVTELGGTDQFTLRLGAQPASPVVLSVTSSDTTEVRPDSTSFTFDGSNWSVPRAVVVRGQDDSVIDGIVSSTITVSVDDAPSDDDFDPLSVSVAVRTTDNDFAGLVLADTASLSVDETGSTDQMTVRLGAEPASPVVLLVSSSDTTEVRPDSASFTFDDTNWDTPRNVLVRGVDDLAVDGTLVSQITLATDNAASDDDFDDISVNVPVATTDNDVAGFSLAGNVGKSVDESGTTDLFTVVLDRQPLSSVVFSISTSDPEEVVSDSTSLTFTTSNWSTPQPVPVRGIDDELDDGDQSSNITVAINAAASHSAFAGLPSQVVPVLTTDDDDAGLTLADTASTSVSEAGTSDPFTLSLSAQPSSPVVIDIVSSDTTEVRPDSAAVTFTTSNWNIPKTIGLRGQDDSLIDGTQNAIVTITVDNASSDDVFDGLADTISVTVTDNDSAGLEVNVVGSLTVSESGSTDDFTVRLTAQPGSDVVIDVTSTDTDAATVAPAQLTFTGSDWSDAQTVTVTGVDDSIDQTEPARLTDILIEVNDAASDDAFDALADTVVAATTDDDGVGIEITELFGTIVTEDGGDDDFGVALTAAPSSEVVLSVTSLFTDEAVVSVDSLTFDGTNWDMPQQVTVTGVDDGALVDGDPVSPINIAVDPARSDDAYDAVPLSQVLVTTLDNDVAAYSLSTPSLSVTEDGSTQFNVVLDAQPVGNVYINLANPGAGDEVDLDESQLEFTNGNWNVAQTVTVSGLDDSPLVDGSQFTTVSASVDGTSDGFWTALSDRTVNVTTSDTDSPGFTVVASGGTTTVTETGGGTTDTLTVVLTAQPLGSVVIDIESLDTTEATVSPASVTFTNANWNVARTIVVSAVNDTPLVDDDQTTSVTFTIDDASSDDLWDAVGGASSQVSIVDTTPPGFLVTESGGSTSVNEDGAGNTDTFTVELTAQPTGTVTLDLANPGTGDEMELDATQLVFGPSTWDDPQTVTVTGVNDTPLVDGDQSTTVTVSVNAGSQAAWTGVSSQQFNVTTTDTDAPGFLILESGGNTTVSETGPGNTDSFSIELTAQPTDTVRLNLTNPGAGDEVDLDETQLVFAPADWDTPQLVTATGVDDPTVDGNLTTTITVAVDGTSPALWTGVANQQLGITTLDDDGPNFTITQSGGSTTVNEDGGGNTDTFTIELTAQPTDTVRLNLANPGAGNEVNLDETQLVFTTASWSTPQTVTATGARSSPSRWTRARSPSGSASETSSSTSPPSIRTCRTSR